MTINCKKEIDRIVLNDKKKNEEYFKRNNKIISNNNKILYETRKAYDRLEKVYKEINEIYSTDNPMSLPEDVFPVRELAKIAYDEEAKKAEALGTKLSCGWNELGATSINRFNAINNFFKKNVIIHDEFSIPQKVVRRVKL